MMHDWEEKLCDEETKRNSVRKNYVICVANNDGGLYPIAVFSSAELAADFINKQNDTLASLHPWLRNTTKFRVLDFVVDSRV